MTANELADWMENSSAYKKAATMLRQRQAEIEKLRKVVEDIIGQAFYEDDYHKAQAKGKIE